MKLNAKAIAVIAAALCLASCGKLDDLGKKKDGEVSLATLRTTATSIDASVPDADEADTEVDSVDDGRDENGVTTIVPDAATNTDSGENTTKKTYSRKTTTTAKKVTTKIPATTKKVTTTKSTTTKATSASTSSSTSASTTPATEKPTDSESQTTPTESSSTQEPETPKELTEFEQDVRVLYSGVEIGIGDKMSEIEGSLGTQAAPSAKVLSCIDANDVAYEYYYFGMTLQVKDDKIFSIEIMDNLYTDPSVYVYTVVNISLNSNKYDVENAYGSPKSSDDNNFYYEEGDTKLQVSFLDDGMVSRIWIHSAK